MEKQGSNPSAVEALAMLESIHPEIHKALDQGAFKAINFFQSEGSEVDRSLESMLVRYHSKVRLKTVFPEVVFDHFSLCGISLLCKDLSWHGRNVNCRLRLWKSFSNELPRGDSKGKRSFYTQPQLEMFPDGSPNEDENVGELKLAILWNLDSTGHLLPLWLVAPKSCNRSTGEIRVWWDIQIPDPASAIKAAASEPAKRDLPLKLKKNVAKKSS